MRALFGILLLTMSLAAEAAEPTTPPTTTTPATTQQHARLRLAVSDLAVEGIDVRVANVVEDALVRELRKHEAVTVVGMAEIKAMLDHEARRQLAGCSEENSCLAEVAEALGVDVIVAGGLARVGDESVITLRRIDQKRAAVMGQESLRLSPADGEEFLAAVGPLVEKLFADRALRAGETRGVDPEIALRLNPPPLPVAVFWSGAALTTATFAAAGVAGVLNAQAGAEYRALAAEDVVEGAVLVDRRDAQRETAVASWVLVGSGAVLAAATGVVALFTDWQGYGAADASASVE